MERADAFGFRSAFAGDFTTIPTHGRAPMRMQPKLTIGATNDPAEHEAARIANQVMRMPGPSVQSQAANSNPERSMAPAAQVQTKSMGANDGGGIEAPPIVREVLSSPGQPLDTATRGFFEPRFGRDFSHVRVHSDAKAAESAARIGARAYTLGHRLVLGENSARSASGRALLAHELTHVCQDSGAAAGTVRRSHPRDAAPEMVGKTFALNAAMTVGSSKLAKGTILTITAWDFDSAVATARVSATPKAAAFTIEKKFLVPTDDSSSGLAQYRAGVAGIENNIDRLGTRIAKQEADITQWKSQEANYKTAKGHADWQAQMDLKQTDLIDLKYKMTGEGFTAATLPERLKTKVGKKMVPITPQSDLLNTALVEETMFNAFDRSIVKWVGHYNKDIGAKHKWPSLDGNLVKSMLYQETHMGTEGQFMLPPPYTDWHPMTRFNLGQAIDSWGPQQIVMINEMSPALATKHNFTQMNKDLEALQKRQSELKKKEASKTPLKPTEQAELTELNRLSGGGGNWTEFYFSDPRLIQAVTEFSQETSPHRNVEYDFWIRTAVRWLFEKRLTVNSWEEAIRAYNGSGTDAKNYRRDVTERAKAAHSSKTDFVPKQHYAP